MTLPLTLRRHHPVAPGVSRRSFRTTICVFAGVALAGCGGERSAAEEASSSESIPEAQLVTYEEASGTADRAWAVLTSGSETPERREGESAFVHFLRNVELSNQRRRDLGMQFWADHPDDARRYQWLILATHLAPHYPADIEAWAESEAQLETNASPIDEQAQSRWDTAYLRMRDEFWSASGVSDADRRYLWYGEIEQRIDRFRRVAARGEPIDVTALLDEVIAYFAEFPAYLNELDRDPFEEAATTIIRQMVFAADELGLSVEDRTAFREALDVGVLQSLEHQPIDEDLWTNFVELGGSDTAPMLSDSARSWRRLPSRGAHYEQRPMPSHWGQPHSLESSLIVTQQREVLNRRYRELGLRLWDRYPDPIERMFWLIQTLQSRPRYLDSIVDGVRGIEANENLTSHIDLDESARWRAVYPKLRAAIWNNPAIVQESRASLRFQELRNSLLDIRSGRASVEELSEALAGVHELWVVYGEVGYGFHARRLASSYVVRSPEELGMTEVDVTTFLEPMLGYADDGLRTLAEGWFRSRALRTTPLEFSAPTLAGEPFDVADLRGKIVLMDYWTTTCSACIAAMPLIHEIYLEYKDKGFEVVSVNFDAERNRRKVERIEHELGLTWPTLNAEDQWEEANARFGWGNILPVYMLLDREGKLVADSADVDLGRNLRQLLDDMLAAEENQDVAQ